MRTQILISLVLWARTALAVAPLVDLGYAKYSGRVVGDGTTQWLGIRYAAPPLGRLRFTAPQRPLNTSGIQDATKFGPICLPCSPTDWTMKPSTHFTVDEDCLYVNVFAPSNASSSSPSLLPVMFFIQGGGFGSNSNANYNGSDLARKGNMIVVSMNYRVGPFGFLQSEELDKEGGLNAGIRDQILALEWVRENVGKFGGNASHVVLNGDSAGAMSLVILMTSPIIIATQPPLFIGAISESVFETSLTTLAQGSQKYACLLSATSCRNTTTTTIPESLASISRSISTDSLSCLRTLNATALQTNCSFGPHFDGNLITKTATEAFESGQYVKVPSIFGATTEEGAKDMGTQFINSTAEANAVFKTKFPGLTNASIDALDRMYLGGNGSWPVFANDGKLWRPMSNAVTEFGPVCLDRYFQNIFAKDGVPSWTYNYAVLDPENEAKGYGAYHTVEIHATWGPNNTDGNPPKSYLPSSSNAPIVSTIQHYWISFIAHLDPNTARLASAPAWGPWNAGADVAGQRLFVRTNETRMQDMPAEQVRRCEALGGLVRAAERGGGADVEVVWDG
ncbi:carboxylesterase [Lophiostoma macrostomum CBS 122681]|uniref:Carboxylic ester hydrolase n=1 Tax=Lophiostoma macrostomum CBS 122681 TaxID=1314788 RepID=A0A6A6TDS8_9PLEO|nr:carboxylesterase [Lophiostoma macrostomum CBS 122681]